MLEPLGPLLREYGALGVLVTTVVSGAITYMSWLSSGRLYTRGQWQEREAGFLRETAAALARAEERIADWRYDRDRNANLAAAATKTLEVVTEMAADLKRRHDALEHQIERLERLLGERNGGAA